VYAWTFHAQEETRLSATSDPTPPFFFFFLRGVPALILPDGDSVPFLKSFLYLAGSRVFLFTSETVFFNPIVSELFFFSLMVHIWSYGQKAWHRLPPHFPGSWTSTLFSVLYISKFLLAWGACFQTGGPVFFFFSLPRRTFPICLPPPVPLPFASPLVLWMVTFLTVSRLFFETRGRHFFLPFCTELPLWFSKVKMIPPPSLDVPSFSFFPPYLWTVFRFSDCLPSDPLPP